MTKQKHLELILKGYGKVAIALSGGLDSSVLLAFATRILGRENVLALVSRAPYMMSNELDYGRELCDKLGLRLLSLEGGLPKEIEFNPSDRCYICKLALFKDLLKLAKENAFEVLADGTNFDDTFDYRPGMKALKELNIASPFLLAKFTKKDIRALARDLGLLELETKASYACLMTRFEVGAKIRLEDLALVDASEDFLRALGFSIFRVRKHSSCARIEFSKADFEKFFRENMLKKVDTKLKELGFKFVSVDLSSYAMGNMNEV